ncbi:MAG TPA: class I SAM-dependent methyltransferase [Tepidisphaeraceae bacterium]|jgi:SAM-dependent methyltransferase|nr:class I SAM-dependent methyltransferase [Tepidisphaeraceae bacterium]
MSDPCIAEQYKTDENLRIRIETHQRCTVGPPLEPAIDRALALHGDESLLDIGTGPGDFPIRLRRSGHRGQIIGIDASPGMIAKANSAGVDVEFVQGDAQSLPFAEKSFDVVTARHMLYHVPDIPRALREARRVLRPGGRFLAVTNARDNMGDYRKALHEAADMLTGRLADIVRIVVPASDVFNDQNGPSLIEDAFGNASATFVEAALRFETAEPALRYFDSCRTMKGLSVQDWKLAREAFAQVIARRLGNGPWIISKTIVLLTAEVPCKSHPASAQT